MNLINQYALLLETNQQIITLPEGTQTMNVNDYFVIQTNRGIEHAKIIYRYQVSDCEKKRKSNISCNKILRSVSPEDLSRIHDLPKIHADYHEAAKQVLKTIHPQFRLIHSELLFDLKHFFIDYTIISEAAAKRKSLISQFTSTLAKQLNCKVIITEATDRNVAKTTGGIGICGYELCCYRFLNKYPQVSVKLAKEQGLPINIPKLSGQCNKLKCCLKYEKENYTNGQLSIEK